MKCSKIRKKLSAYLDGEMPEHERSVISEHLQQCKECRAELTALSAVRDALNSIEGMEVPPYFMTRLRQHIKEQREPVPFRQRIRGLVFTAATAFALVASLFIGNQAGKTLYQSIAHTPEPVVAETNNVFGLGAFEEFPDNSLSDIYNELVTGGNNG
jgi:anti-sigma factor (TIGR02949 family)